MPPRVSCTLSAASPGPDLSSALPQATKYLLEMQFKVVQANVELEVPHSPTTRPHHPQFRCPAALGLRIAWMTLHMLYKWNLVLWSMVMLGAQASHVTVWVEMDMFSTRVIEKQAADAWWAGEKARMEAEEAHLRVSPLPTQAVWRTCGKWELQVAASPDTPGDPCRQPQQKRSTARWTWKRSSR